MDGETKDVLTLVLMLTPCFAFVLTAGIGVMVAVFRARGYKKEGSEESFGRRFRRGLDEFMDIE